MYGYDVYGYGVYGQNEGWSPLRVAYGIPGRAGVWRGGQERRRLRQLGFVVAVVAAVVVVPAPFLAGRA